MTTDFDLIYAGVPGINCKGLCHASCGPIAASDREIDHFEKTTGKSFPDALKVLSSTEMRCPHLNVLNRCNVYQNRPLICRLWGIAEEMPCIFGCAPERVLSRKEAYFLMDQTA